MNKFLIFLLLMIALIIVSLTLTSKNNDDITTASAPAPQQKQAKNRNTLSQADRDTYETTVKTISANTDALRREIQRLKNAQTQQKHSQVSEADRQKKFDAIINDKLKKRFSLLSKGFTEKLKNINARLKNNPGSMIPKGLGFDNLRSGQVPINNNTGNHPSLSTNPPEIIGQRGHYPVNEANGHGSNANQIVTIMPVTTVAYAENGNKNRNRQHKLTIDGKIITNEVSNKPPVSPMMNSKKLASVPMITVPKNATLVSNATMSALVGIIPVKGSVLNPFKFKVITGGNNLATNGHVIHGIKNIVWSGTAIGNRAMSCVRGELHSVTFTFNDGTVITKNARGIGGQSSFGNSALGYISNQRGNPCIPGKLITNASDYLKDRMIASGIASAAQGFTTTQQTTNTTPQGGVQQFFSGNTGNYVAASALKGGLTELSDYLRERARNAVDLVFLQAGQNLVINVETEIDIDYPPDGRKLNYAHNTEKLAAYNLD